MTTFLKSLALLLAVAQSASFGAALIGLQLPAIADPAMTFSAFVCVLTLLTIGADYRRINPLRQPAMCSVATIERAELRLAA